MEVWVYLGNLGRVRKEFVNVRVTGRYVFTVYSRVQVPSRFYPSRTTYVTRMLASRLDVWGLFSFLQNYFRLSKLSAVRVMMRIAEHVKKIARILAERIIQLCNRVALLIEDACSQVNFLEKDTVGKHLARERLERIKERHDSRIRKSRRHAVSSILQYLWESDINCVT